MIPVSVFFSLLLLAMIGGIIYAFVKDAKRRLKK